MNAIPSSRPVDAAEPPPIVLILKKTQGSVWSEAGRTPLCPTLGWLRDKYGAGQYELRLKRGNRTLCMTLADCLGPPASEEHLLTRSSVVSGTGRDPARIGLRGIVPV
jgi:hypothetical protein